MSRPNPRVEQFRGKLRYLLVLGVFSPLLTGCQTSQSQTMLRQSHYRAYQLHQSNQLAQSQVQSLAAERERLRQQNEALAADVQNLRTETEDLNKLRNELNVANQRIDNLSSERSELQQRYISLLNSGKPSPLTPGATRRFEELAEKYPNFEFDPQTGVAKFHSDILFSTGSDKIRDGAIPLLKDFTQIMNSPDSRNLHVLVVGHTDDQRIAKSKTQTMHPTNWHLSTNRANAVVNLLGASGMAGNRMGAAGYSMYQPVVPNSNSESRSRNRRVEIFILAPDAVIAGWDPEKRKH